MLYYIIYYIIYINMEWICCTRHPVKLLLGSSQKDIDIVVPKRWRRSFSGKAAAIGFAAGSGSLEPPRSLHGVESGKDILTQIAPKLIWRWMTGDLWWLRWL